MYINVSSQHVVCVHRFIAFGVFDMHILYMCRYACTCFVSVCIYIYMYLHVCIEVHVHM